MKHSSLWNLQVKLEDYQSYKDSAMSSRMFAIPIRNTSMLQYRSEHQSERARIL